MRASNKGESGACCTVFVPFFKGSKMIKTLVVGNKNSRCMGNEYQESNDTWALEFYPNATVYTVEEYCPHTGAVNIDFCIDVEV
jgi:hypothetical protein